jgi:hypothetical protein
MLSIAQFGSALWINGSGAAASYALMGAPARRPEGIWRD